MIEHCYPNSRAASQRQAIHSRWERQLTGHNAHHGEFAQADRRKNEFLATLGHELRNPLSDILNAIEVLEHLSGHDADTVAMHGAIKRQSLHMARLVEDLSNMSRIACGKITLQMARLTRRRWSEIRSPIVNIRHERPNYRWFSNCPTRRFGCLATRSDWRK